MLTTIPFAGFYNSIHDEAFDNALDTSFCDDRGQPLDDLRNRALDAVEWGDARRAYAADYAARFARLARMPSLTFESMTSPREYNFATDRISCHVSADDLRAVIARLPAGALDLKAAERFTSRSGFISHYSPDVADWGDLETWDYNQAGTILEALADTLAADRDAWDMWDESALMEDAQCNGAIENWLFASPAMQRLDRVHSYLRDRAARG